jgi:ketosteroid isomerase-like protein
MAKKGGCCERQSGSKRCCAARPADGASEASGALERGGRFEGAVAVEEVRVSGDWAYCWTQLEVSITHDAGEPTRLAGSAMAVLRRKADGRWVIFRDANMLAPVR